MSIRITFIFISIVLTFFVIKTRWFDDNGERWKFIVDSDGGGYYAHLPAIFIYHTFDYRFAEKCEAKLQGLSNPHAFNVKDGKLVNKYFIGEAVLLLPFFLLSYFISFLTHHDLSGYNEIFFGSVAFAAIFYAITGLFFTRKILQLYNIRESWIAFILLLIVFGTNVFYYVVYEPSLSHVYSFAIVSIFVWSVKKFQVERTGKYLVYASLALGLVTIIRPVNVMIVLAVPFLSGSVAGFIELAGNIFKSPRNLLVAMICFMSVISIQLMEYYAAYGKLFYWTYRGEGLDFSKPHFWDLLISYRKGFFIYTPLMFIAVLSVVSVIKRSVFEGVSFLIFFVIVSYVISCWSSWEYGGSFGMRPLIEYYSVLIIPLAYGLNGLYKPGFVFSVVFLLLLITGYCMFQTYQYQRGIISFYDMDKEKYWKVFLESDLRYRLVASPPVVEKIGRDSIQLKQTRFMDFEDLPGDADGVYNTAEFYSGRQCMKVDKKAEFSQGFLSKCQQLMNDSIRFLEVSLMAKKYDDKNDAALIVSLERPDTKIYLYNSYPISLLMNKKKEWERMIYSVKLPAMEAEDVLKIYVWNPSPSPFFIDNFKVDFFSLKY